MQRDVGLPFPCPVGPPGINASRGREMGYGRRGGRGWQKGRADAVFLCLDGFTKQDGGPPPPFIAYRPAWSSLAVSSQPSLVTQVCLSGQECFLQKSLRYLM